MEGFHKHSLWFSGKIVRVRWGKVGTEGRDRPLGFEDTPETLSRLQQCQLQWLNGQPWEGNIGIGRLLSLTQSVLTRWPTTRDSDSGQASDVDVA